MESKLRKTSCHNTFEAMKHAANGNALKSPFPENTKMAMFGMGCFWGAEKLFWELKGVYSTQVGYSAGNTENPTYREVCTGVTNHAEVVRVIYNPNEVQYDQLLKAFWENHIPTKGSSHKSQYRSGIYYYDNDQKVKAEESKKMYQQELSKKLYGEITTEIRAATEFYYAEDYHQQYLHKNSGGYCGHGGTGVSCPIGIRKKDTKT